MGTLKEKKVIYFPDVANGGRATAKVPVVMVNCRRLSSKNEYLWRLMPGSSSSEEGQPGKSWSSSEECFGYRTECRTCFGMGQFAY